MVQFLTKNQGLLAVPFVLHSHPTAVFEPNGESVEQQANVAQRRYAEILRDVEEIINDHSESSDISSLETQWSCLVLMLCSSTPEGWQTR